MDSYFQFNNAFHNIKPDLQRITLRHNYFFISILCFRGHLDAWFTYNRPYAVLSLFLELTVFLKAGTSVRSMI